MLMLQNKSPRAKPSTPIKAVAVILAVVGGVAASILLIGPQRYPGATGLLPNGQVQRFHYIAHRSDGGHLQLELKGAVDSDTTVSELRIDDAAVPYIIDPDALVAAGKVAHIATAFPFPVGASHEVALVSASGETFRARLSRPGPNVYVTERLP